jgi:hypothetical protein
MSDRCASYPEGFDEIDRAYVDAIKAIPDGSFVQGLMSVVSFVAPDGTNMWRLVHEVEIPVSQAIGLLHMASIEMMAQTPHAITHLSEPDDG